MGAAQSQPPEAPPPKPLEEMTIEELQRELQDIRNKIAKTVEQTEILRMECVKGERLLTIIRAAQRQVDKVAQGSDIRALRV